MVTLIWAEDKNHGIGKDNKLPWSIPEEMKHFRETTRGGIVVMGRKTFESIGRPLPKRENIVISRSNFQAEGIILYNSIEKVVEDYKGKDIFVIGGETIYKAFFKYADKLIISVIKNEYSCDTFMTDVPYKDFRMDKLIESPEFDIQYYSRNTNQFDIDFDTLDTSPKEYKK